METATWRSARFPAVECLTFGRILAPLRAAELRVQTKFTIFKYKTHHFNAKFIIFNTKFIIFRIPESADLAVRCVGPARFIIL